jgi:ABC-type uncharacterized transport system substrate-binding protein
VRDHRVAVGVSLQGKIREHGFFLTQIISASRAIEQKHLQQDYPINREVDQLNYFFSAYLNTIQSLKDGSQTATGATLRGGSSRRRTAPFFGIRETQSRTTARS